MKIIQPIILSLLAGILFNIIGCKHPEQDFGEEEVFALDSTILSVSVISSNLNVPWDIAWGPEDHLFITEQSGSVSRIDVRTGNKKQLLKIDEVWRKRTSGLLGMALHPDMKNHPFVFVDYTTKKGKDSLIYTKLVRYTYENDTLTDAKVLLEIEGANSHNGSRLAFSKDGKLLWATGDLQKKGYAQDSTSLFGKILRMNIDGTVPVDNPIKGSLVYAWGFRNMQGLAVSKKGNIFTSEHGDAMEDELNLIKPLQNYGWPEIEGFHDLAAEKAIAAKFQRTEPIKSWTPTIAPAGIDMFEATEIPEWKNSILLTTLKGKALRVLKLSNSGDAITSDQVFIEGKYGRLRDVCVSPSGDVYVSTSNQDWNPSPGFPKENDDRILRIRRVRTSKTEAAALRKQASMQKKQPAGLLLYNQYCGSCHKENGLGVAGTFPALQGSKKVLGAKDQLITSMIKGVPEPGKPKESKYEQNMPAFNFLSDLEVAEIATYIRASWGNNTTAVSVADVKKVRD